MFDITVEDPSPNAEKGKHVHVWQNSWGLSTRVIGVMVMIHGMSFSSIVRRVTATFWIFQTLWIIFHVLSILLPFRLL